MKKVRLKMPAQNNKKIDTTFNNKNAIRSFHFTFAKKIKCNMVIELKRGEFN